MEGIAKLKNLLPRFKYALQIDLHGLLGSKNLRMNFHFKFDLRYTKSFVDIYSSDQITLETTTRDLPRMMDDETKNSTSFNEAKNHTVEFFSNVWI